MKRFSFKLDRVLSYRATLEEEKKRLLAEAQRAVAAQEEQIHIIGSEIDRQMVELRARSVAALDVRDAIARRLYISYLRAALSLAHETLASLNRQLEERRNELIQASKEKKVLERLKQRRFSEYIYELDKEEQKFIDEIGVFKR